MWKLVDLLIKHVSSISLVVSIVFFTYSIHLLKEDKAGLSELERDIERLETVYYFVGALFFLWGAREFRKIDIEVREIDDEKNDKDEE